MKWTKTEESYLKKYYPERTTSELAYLLGRTEFSIQAKAVRMKLHKSNKFKASKLSGRFLRRKSFAERIKGMFFTRKMKNVQLNRWRVTVQPGSQVRVDDGIMNFIGILMSKNQDGSVQILGDKLTKSGHSITNIYPI